ncbi:MAG: mannose-1-phosphate guanylyltransferase/mannose-6-phosphate isomerase [Desulfobulbaceae bacterium]|nr:mannose-1-phosphate guanylyltransferase/mannose-6-phosphate isomerase [Desulfobulbaceae bacterium]
MKLQPVILAGGTGSRLWPLSRELYPKQLINLTGEDSLLQTTLKRVSELPNCLSPIIVVGEEHRFLTKNQVEELGIFSEYHLLLEPIGRNTAPAISGAAFYAKKVNGGEDVVLLVLPADHLIAKPLAFGAAVEKAMRLAGEGRLVTFGVAPDHPETGYGYILRGENNQVAKFVEKPDLATAQEYVASGRYFWNSGMFAFSVDTLLAEMELHSPDMIHKMAIAVENGKRDGVFFRFSMDAMMSCPSDSIDYAVMERTSKASVVEADMGWSDIGSWLALWEVAEKDAHGNVVTGDVILEDVENSLIRAGDTLVAAVGLRDTMIIETADAVLVAPISKSQDVKKVVARLKKSGRGEFQVHRTVFRPWGSFTTLELQERFQIKRISVKPRSKLSLQMHYHRHEHWVVVNGTALVTTDDREVLLHENQSVYIPAGTKHRLENPGTIPLELIEVQIGSYLGEDDIVRFDDDYGRKA